MPTPNSFSTPTIAMPTLAPAEPHLPKLGGNALALRICTEAHRGRILRLKAAKCSIGSAAQCTLRLRARGVAPMHCLILRGPGGTVVRRWSSDTFLNDQAFADAALTAGDRLRLGPVEVEVLSVGSQGEALAPRSDASASTGPGLREAAAPSGEKLRELQDQAARLDAQRAELETQRNAFERQRRQWENQFCGGASQLAAETEWLNSQKAQLERQGSDLNARAAELESKLAQWQARKAQADVERSELEARTRDLQAKAAELNARASELDRRWADLNVQATAMEAERAELSHRAGELEAKASESDARAADLDRRWADLNAQATAMEAERAELSRRGGELEAKASESDARAADLDRRWADLNARAAAVEAEQAELSRRGGDLEAKASESDARARELDRRSSDLGAQAAELQEQWSALDRRASDLEAKTTDLDGRAAGLDQRWSEVNAQAADLQRRATDLDARTAELEAPPAAFPQPGDRWPQPWADGAPQGDTPPDLADASEPPEETGLGLGDVPGPMKEVKEAEEESIDSYMSQLMERLRSSSGASGVAARSPRPEPCRPAVEPRGAAASGTAPPAVALPVSQPQVRHPVQIMPRAEAPEKRVDLSALRELANLSAHLALNRHARKGLLRALYAKLMVTSVAVIVGVALLWMWNTMGCASNTFYAALAALMVAVLFGIEYAVLTGRLIVNQSGHLDWKSAQREPVEPPDSSVPPPDQPQADP